jgi:hypothetical protein
MPSQLQIDNPALIPITGRDEQLPKIYRLASHPLVPKPEGRQIFLYYSDQRQEGSINALDVGSELTGMSFLDSCEASTEFSNNILQVFSL